VITINYNYPFNKWNKDKIISIIRECGFVFYDEYAGIFKFYYMGNKFSSSYILYLQKTSCYICNPNVRITDPIKSYKQLKEWLTKIYYFRNS